MSHSSCIYRGWVRHRRKAPRAHEFSYRLYMLYLDLAELPDLFRGRLLWSHEKPNIYSFRRADYLGPTDIPLDAAVRDAVERHTGARPAGPIRMLTQIRSFGYVFNPVTFYYCFDENEEPDAIVAEITNTPWGERHRYILQASTAEARHFDFDFAKEFHISPFMGMDLRYAWRFSKPGDDLLVHMGSQDGDRKVFDVTMQLERRPWTGAQLARTALRHPAMTTKIMAGIYWQAFRLYLKRTPFFPHPATRSSEEEITT